MANRQHPGFKPVKTTGNTFQRVRRPGPDNGSRIRMYDAVVYDGDEIVLATTTNTAVAGASLGCSYKDISTGIRYDSEVLPANNNFTGTTFFAEDRNWVYLPSDALNTRYVASVDEAMAITDMNLNFVMVLASTTTRYSDHELDATSRNTTATLPWRVHAPFNHPGIDPDLADAWFECSINAGMLEPAASDYTGS